MKRLALAAVVAVALLAGCGEKSEKVANVISGPGNVKYHHHAQLHVYNDGLLVPVPTHIGLGPGGPAALHTHAPGGVIHIEASRPFKPTLGAFFAIWGVPF